MQSLDPIGDMFLPQQQNFSFKVCVYTYENRKNISKKLPKFPLLRLPL